MEYEIEYGANGAWVPHSALGAVPCSILVECPVCDGTGKIVRRFGNIDCRHCGRGEGDLWCRDADKDKESRGEWPAYTNSKTGVTVWTISKSI